MKSIKIQNRAGTSLRASHSLLCIALALAVFLTGEVARAVDSTWTGSVDSNWNTPGNWTGDVPNNNGVDTFNAFVVPINGFAFVNVQDPVVIDNLQVGGNGGAQLQVSDTSFSVLHTSSSADDFVYLSAEAFGVATTVDLGTFANFSSETLSGVRISSVSYGAQATVQWAGANIHTIASDAQISLHGTDSSIRNSLDNSDALAGIQTNEGSFSIYNRDFVTVGNFSNSGILTAQANNADATISINGTLAQNTGSDLTAGQLIVGGGVGVSGVIEWEGAAIETISTGAGVILSGDSLIRNSQGNLDALENLHSNHGSFEISDRDFTRTGDFSNTGWLSASAYNSDSKLSISGTLAQNAGLVLTAGYLQAGSQNGFAAVIEWDGADIQTIGSNAGVTLDGADSSIRNSQGNVNALEGLHSNEGSFAISNRDFTRTGDFSNTGFLNVGSYTFDSTLLISGTLAQNSGTVLTAGQLYLSAYNGVSSVIKWDGAEIQTIGDDAAISLQGADTFILNSADDSNALENLQSNAGFFSIADRDFTTAGDFSNSGYLSISNGVLATSAGGDFLMDSTSTLEIGILSATSFGSVVAEGLVTLDGDFTVSLNLWNGAPIVESSDVFVVIAGQSIAGAFANITDGERIFDQSGAYSFLYTVTADSVILSEFTAVPEPGTCGLLLLGGAGLLLRRRRRVRRATHLQ